MIEKFKGDLILTPDSWEKEYFSEISIFFIKEFTRIVLW